MNKKYLSLLLLPFVIAGMFFVYQNKATEVSAQSYGGLLINTGVPEGEPIFFVSNFLPGDCEERTISVKNVSTIAQDLTVRSRNVEDTNLLSHVLNIEILEQSQLYNKPLNEFFDESGTLDGILLNSVAPEETKVYTFKVCFESESGNEYQNTEVVFDLVFGNVISPIKLPEECSHLRGIVTSVINGRPGNDRIDGTSASELILGNGGNDRIDGGSGHDCIVTLDGEDRVDGGSGNDVIVGGGGNNRLEGGSGDDTIYALTGNDRINGDAGNDTIYSGGGNDTIYGDSGHDKIYSEEGNDKIYGDTGDDYLNGGNDFDRLYGGTGTDECIFGEHLSNCEI